MEFYNYIAKPMNRYLNCKKYFVSEIFYGDTF